MSVKYKVLPKKNPRDMVAPEKFYATVVADGETNFDKLAKQIAYQSAVTEADCYSVLMSLEHNIINELVEGRIVKLGLLGNFQIGISSLGKDTAEEVSANSIKKNRILFRPGKKMRELLDNLSYRKAS